MNNNKKPARLQERVDQLDFFVKPARNLIWIFVLLGGLWAQYLGPGINVLLREWSGSNDLHLQMTEGFNRVDSRLEFMEDNMTPPKILNWISQRALGSCNEESCKNLHTVSRTLYGENCGQPIISIELKMLNYEPVPMKSSFRAQNVDLLNTRIIHDFKLEDFMIDGDHEYQFTLIYPTCAWDREPIPRYSPWFPITIKRQ